MKLLIAIPSKNRVEILMNNTLLWVPSCDIDWKVFVEPQDFEKYKTILAEEKLVNIGQNDQGLGFAKQFIKDFAKVGGYTHIFKVDDDIKGFTKYRKKLDPPRTAQWVKEFTKDIEKSLELHPQVKCVSFPYSFEMYEKKHWEVAKRVQTAFIIETDWLYVNPKVSVFEDFATGLSVLVNGGLVAKFCMAGINMGVKVGGGTGGHQSYDRFERAKLEAEELRKLYPPLNFRLVNKPWKIEPDMTSIDLPKKNPSPMEL